MTFQSRLVTAAVFVSCCAWAQTGEVSPRPVAWNMLPLMEPSWEVPDPAQQPVPNPGQQPPVEAGPIPQGEPYYIEFGGFENFVDNNYGRWSGVNGRIMFRHLKAKGLRHFTPIVSFATQTRPNGTQATFGLDSYINFNKWFYMIAGVGGSPPGSALLWPQFRFGATGLVTIPGVKGLVGTLGAAQIRAGDGSYGNVFSPGALYYRGHAIWSGYVSFNRNYPGSVASKSGGVAVQYGAEKKYWIGAGMGGGRIAYETIALHPLDVRFLSFGPNFFFQKWITPKWGLILKYDYQDELLAYQRHGISASVFFEVGPVSRALTAPSGAPITLPNR
jgi:YaiO family outer membrane protein